MTESNIQNDKAQCLLAPATCSARDWSKDFNSLPEDVRTIGCVLEARTRIQQLEMEKERLKKHYRQSVDEIDGHIENCRVWLHKLEVPNVES
jgi:hypothetical protein